MLTFLSREEEEALEYHSVLEAGYYIDCRDQSTGGSQETFDVASTFQNSLQSNCPQYERTELCWHDQSQQHQPSNLLLYHNQPYDVYEDANNNNNNDTIGNIADDSCPLSDTELIKLTIRDLNKRLDGVPDEVINKLKHRRRTLKNRGYAQNCRYRRLRVKIELENVNKDLREQIKRLEESNLELRQKLESNNKLVAKLRSRN